MPLVLFRYWKQIALVGFTMALLAIVYGMGYSRAANRYELKLFEQQKAYDVVHQEARNALDKLEIETHTRLMMESVVVAERARKRDVIVQEVTKWRTRYAKNPDAGNCSVPAEFVCIADATSLDDLSEAAIAACRADDGPSGISDVELLSYLTDAKRLCLGWRDGMIEWRDRERAIQGSAR